MPTNEAFVLHKADDASVEAYEMPGDPGPDGKLGLNLVGVKIATYRFFVVIILAKSVWVLIT